MDSELATNETRCKYTCDRQKAVQEVKQSPRVDGVFFNGVWRGGEVAHGAATRWYYYDVYAGHLNFEILVLSVLRNSCSM